MRKDAIEQAATLLAEARLRRQAFDGLPETCRPRGEAEAYAIQDRLHAALEGKGKGSLIGHKIGCTTDVMQRYLGIPSPCAGGLFAPTVMPSPGHFRHGDFCRVGAECEIAVRLDADLPPRDDGHDRSSVANAVECCMAAIEIVDDRYVDYRTLDTPTLIADDFFNAGAVLGPEVADWRLLDLVRLEGYMAANGERVGEGVGSAILGHPLEALAWLAQAKNVQGRGLQKGEIVLLGSIVQTRWVAAGDRVDIVIDGLGSVSVTFT